MQKQEEVENLKRRLFQKDNASEEDKFIRLSELIESCGGYKNFLETPIAVIMEMDRMLDRRVEEQNKMFGVMSKGRGGK